MEYKQLYDWGVKELCEQGIKEAPLDARLLLEAVCGTGKHDLLVYGDKELPEEQYNSYVNHIRKRKNHIPLQYITGKQEFMGLTFRVTPDVLIPRQDTEILVEEVLRHLHDGMSLLDMCTGSGCILLSILQYSNDCRGTGADVSREALGIAGENAENLNLSAEWIESDFFGNISGKYDILVSNPPYIPTTVIESLMKEVKDYEPLIALDGGSDGLDFYRQIVKEAGDHIYSGGMLFFEIGCEQGKKVSEIMREAGWKEITVVQDLSGLDRVVYGVYGGK